MTNKLKSLFINLHSNQYDKRSNAVSSIMSTRDPYVLRDIGHYIEENAYDDSIIIIIGMCEEILKEDDVAISHHALYILNTIIHLSSEILAHKAKDALYLYFKNLNVIDGHKALTIEKSWQRIKTNHRFFLTEIIQEFKYHTLVNLLLDNFNLNNSKLIITSIYALNDLKESRGNRFLRELLNFSDLEIQKAAINALGNTGIFWDYFKIKNFIYHDNIDLRKTSISAIRKLVTNKSLKVFKETFYQQPLIIQKTILEETTTLHTPKALVFLLELLADTDISNLSNIIEWSVYNIQTKKKIGTIINFFPKADTKTKYRLINLLGDFDDDKCRTHFINTLNSTEDIMVKSLALHHLSHYKDKLTILELEKHLNNPNRIIRYSCIKSLLNVNKDVAKKTIDNLLSKHEDLNDETIMLIVRNLKNQPRLLENTMYSLFLFEVLQTGTDDTKLSILSILPQNHNFEVFQFLTELYHDSDYENIKDHIALSQLYIILDFPYYLSAETLTEDLEYLINMINPYKANYQIILHLIRLQNLVDNEIIENFIEDNKMSLALKLNYIINKNELTFDDLNMVINYLFSSNMNINEENFQFIIDNHFSKLSYDNKSKFLGQLLEYRSEKYYSFIIDNYYSNKSNYTHLKKSFNNYLGSIL